MRRSTFRAGLAALVLAAATACFREDEDPAVHVYTREGSAGTFRVTVADSPETQRSVLAEPIPAGASVLVRAATEARHELPPIGGTGEIDVLYTNAMQTIVDVQAATDAGTAPPPARAPWVMALVLRGGFVEESGVMIGDKIDPRNVPPPPT